jgi:hypothetical protein
MSTGASQSIPASSYLCWEINVTSNSGNSFDLEYDTTTFTTNVSTPTISVPELGLGLIGLGLLAPVAARRRRPIAKPLSERAAAQASESG